jgi:two-component system phosphate regulon sensor histidine kinase PhoR
MAQLTTRQVSVLAALVTAIGGGILVGVSVSLMDGPLAIWVPFLSAVVLFGIAYAVLSLAIEQFVNSRIKVLYRTVHNLKRNRPNGERTDAEGDAIDRVNTEVREWARERRTEIKELEEREKFRREFIGNLAHELKTPIFNIQGYILTLLEGGLEDEKVNRDFLNRASNGVDRLMKIVEDLDMITKLESGVMDLKLKALDLRETVEEAITELEMQARDKGVTLRNEMADDVVVMADKGRLLQVLMNLLNNAIIYGREGGSCAVTSYPLDEQVLVEVSDDGIGISEEHLPRLFERFYRVGKSRARNEGGSGLGLAIVKHIIEAHGQTISVKSREGEGATFSFTLQKAPQRPGRMATS